MQVSTVLEIKNLSAEGYYSVAGCRGLQLRVTKYGKEFYYRYTWQGKRVLLKIGNMKSVSLSDAKKRTFELAELVAKGINPKEKKNYNDLREEQPARTNGAEITRILSSFIF